jgi:hypothetical protein
MPSVEELFCSVDDFCQVFEHHWQSQLISHDLQVRTRKRSLCLSEVMTILIGFHQSYYRNFKSYYLEKVQTQWQSHFPQLVSYNRFIEWVPDTSIPLCAYLRSCFGTCTGISFMDSTGLKVCHNRRINQHKVFKDIAARGKTSVDWFFGLKLHLVINDKGELLNFQVTPGNTDDRKPVPDLLQHLFGQVFADKGYISQKMFEELMDSVGVRVVTKLKRNMKQRLMSLSDRLLLRKRAVAEFVRAGSPLMERTQAVETVIDQLKNISQIEHSRHRSPVNCFVNILCGLIAYCHQPKKPGIAMESNLLCSA